MQLQPAKRTDKRFGKVGKKLFSGFTVYHVVHVYNSGAVCFLIVFTFDKKKTSQYETRQTRIKISQKTAKENEPYNTHMYAIYFTINKLQTLLCKTIFLRP